VIFCTVSRPVTGRLTAMAMSASRFERLKTRGSATIWISSAGFAAAMAAQTCGRT
jgi:hypothetical protein